MPAPLVKLASVSKRFGLFQALSEVSFELRPGEVFGYIGPNGAGKTTTLKILAGLIPSFDGEVEIDGRSLAGNRDGVHELIGFLPQAAGFQLWRTVDNTLRTLGTLSGLDAATLDARASTLLERFDLAGVRGVKVKQLSGGMTQKLGLIQALLHEPKLLVLDEPLGGLDPVSRQLVKDIVAERRSAGATIIFSSHILSDVQTVADRIGILSQGRIVTVGTVDELKAEFGMPVDIGLELAQVPSDTDYIHEPTGVDDVEREAPDRWRVRLAAGADADAVTHELITRTLSRGGRLRSVGVRDANLDDLYATYVTANATPTDALAAN